MNAAMYKAISGSVAQMRRLDVATQNLANLKTAAYKGQRLAFGEMLAAPRDAADRKSTRLNSSHIQKSRMPSSA